MALREFLSTVKASVFDLSDPENDERISQDPEGWVMDVLSHPHVQVSHQLSHQSKTNMCMFFNGVEIPIKFGTCDEEIRGPG